MAFVHSLSGRGYVESDNYKSVYIVGIYDAIIIDVFLIGSSASAE